MANNKNVERVAKCRAKLSRVELLFKPEERAEIERAANGRAVSAYIKAAVREKLEREGR